MKNIWFINCILLAALVLIAGCATRISDPLIGWHFSSLNNLHSNKAIMDDYQNYIQELSPKERKYIGFIEYFEDGTGQHAIRITIAIKDANWRHVLIYDKDDRRIQTVKYISGYSHS